MVSDAVLLLIALIGLCSTVLIVLFFAGYFRGGSTRIADAAAADAGDGVVKAGGRRGAAGGLAAIRKRKDKKRAGAEQAAAAAPQQQQQQQQEAEAEVHAAAAGEDGAAAADVAADGLVEPRALTKKELQKEMKKREREEMRRFEEARREEQRERNEAREAALQKKRDDDAAREAARDAEATRVAAEREKRDQDEFDAWKGQFVVEEAGAKNTDDSDASQTLLQQFVDFIKRRKVVLLEDLATEFGLTTQDAIDRVEALTAAHRLSGLIDDRGKFIYITEDEMDKVAKCIARKGRLGLAELAKECNKLIRLEGDAASDAPVSVDWLDDAVAAEGEDSSP